MQRSTALRTIQQRSDNPVVRPRGVIRACRRPTSAGDITVQDVAALVTAANESWWVAVLRRRPPQIPTNSANASVRSDKRRKQPVNVSVLSETHRDSRRTGPCASRLGAVPRLPGIHRGAGGERQALPRVRPARSPRPCVGGRDVLGDPRGGNGRIRARGAGGTDHRRRRALRRRSVHVHVVCRLPSAVRRLPSAVMRGRVAAAWRRPPPGTRPMVCGQRCLVRRAVVDAPMPPVSDSGSGGGRRRRAGERAVPGIREGLWRNRRARQRCQIQLARLYRPKRQRCQGSWSAPDRVFRRTGGTR